MSFANARRGWTRREVVLAASAALPLAAGMRRLRSSANEAECATLSVFPVPSGDRPHDVAPAADGVSVWYTAQGSGRLGLLHPLTGEIKRIPLGQGSSPHGVIVGPDGAAWITDSGRDEIQRVDPETQEIARYPIGLSRAALNTAAFDGDGALWFTGQNGVLGRLDPARGDVVTADAPRGRGPYGISATPDGTPWFVSLAGSYLGRLELLDGEIRTAAFDPPTPDAGLRRVWADSRGWLWVAQWLVGQVGVYDPARDEWREWRLPGDRPQAYSIYVDDVDIVWLTDFGANAIVRFDPEVEQFDVYELPHPAGNVRQMLGRQGEVWGAESGTDHLVVVRTICAGP